MSVIAVLPRLLGLTAAGILLFVLIPVDMETSGNIFGHGDCPHENKTFSVESVTSQYSHASAEILCSSSPGD